MPDAVVESILSGVYLCVTAKLVLVAILTSSVSTGHFVMELNQSAKPKLSGTAAQVIDFPRDRRIRRAPRIARSTLRPLRMKKFTMLCELNRPERIN